MLAMKNKKAKWFAVLWFAVTMTLAAVAQDEGSSTPPPDSNGPNVDLQSGQGSQENGDSQSNAAPESNAARVSITQRERSMHRGATRQWASVTINTRPSSGDELVRTQT